MSLDEERHRNRGCTGKHRHETFSAAKRQAKQGKKRHIVGVKNVKIEPYYCNFCGGYHVGHNKKKGKK